MASLNPFDLLGEDDTGELSILIAAQQKAASTAASAAPPKKGSAQSQVKPQPKTQAKLPSKPLPPAQAVREAKIDGARGGRGYGRGRGRGGNGGYRRDYANDENSFSNSVAPAGQGAPEDGESGKPSERRGYGGPRPYRGGGGRRGGFSNGEARDGERPRRAFERHSGTGRGNEFKREGSGRGNWGTQTDELFQATEEDVNESKKNPGDEKPAGEDDAEDANKENPTNEPEEKPEDKEMTLEEYEKVLAEKRKALQALKTEGRKVDAKEFESMKQLSNKKKSDDEIFIPLILLTKGSDKDKRKEANEKEERTKKSVSINEFLKPAEGERYNQSGRGRGPREFGGGSAASNVAAPSIQDPGHFPTLGGK